jgi:gamma-glutamylcyclotransferase (GGCT)/AIG2-like uncharacterized protein YtfP
MPTNESAKRRIAVYGSLRKSEYNYRKEMGEPIACGRIIGAQLFSLGAFPCIVRNDANNGDSVEVEVYDLPEKVFNSIEAMELGAGYRREEITFVDHAKDEPEIVEAYFYPAKQDWFGPQIVSGDWTLRGTTP